MAAYQLAVNGARHGRKVEPPALLGHPRMKDHLEQQIAELVAQLFRATELDGLGDLVRLFDRVRRYGCERLFAVPRTAVLRVAEARHEGDQIGHGSLGFAHEDSGTVSARQRR